MVRWAGRHGIELAPERAEAGGRIVTYHVVRFRPRR